MGECSRWRPASAEAWRRGSVGHVLGTELGNCHPVLSFLRTVCLIPQPHPGAAGGVKRSCEKMAVFIPYF